MRYIPILTISLCLAAFSAEAPALTTDEILRLKEHGVSDKTIELMIQSEMEERKQSESSIQISKEKSSIIYSTGKPSSTPLTQQEQENTTKAWEMLKNLSIEIEK